MKNHEKFYLQNTLYTKFLDTQSEQDFRKYTDYILHFTSRYDQVLDVGCGTGIALTILKKQNRKVFGVEVSTLSVKRCLERGLNCQVYNGRELPFEDSFFDLVGSYNVLEHVNNPLDFLDENLRVVRSGGFLMVVCPNFLSITNSYHPRTTGLIQKLRNLTVIIEKLLSKEVNFDKMESIVRENFQPDDDACNVTNPVDVLRWARARGLKLEHWSSQPVYKKGIVNLLDHSFLRLLLGSLFVVFRKV